MSSKIAMLLIIFAIIIAFPPVHADSDAYVIPLEGARWTSNTIQVYISGGEEWQQNQALQAMQLWNQAQLWFAREYFPNSPVYMFNVGNSSAPVQVTLLNASTIVENLLGWTDYHKQNGMIESVNVRIAATNSAHALLVLSSHEFGHVLGLGDDVICCKKDLMNAFPIVNNVSALPTTLDLFALHILAIANAIPSFVWLSNGIPYETALATPGFSGSPSVQALPVLEDLRKGSMP